MLKCEACVTRNKSSFIFLFDTNGLPQTSRNFSEQEINVHWCITNYSPPPQEHLPAGSDECSEGATSGWLGGRAQRHAPKSPPWAPQTWAAPLVLLHTEEQVNASTHANQLWNWDLQFPSDTLIKTPSILLQKHRNPLTENVTFAFRGQLHQCQREHMAPLSWQGFLKPHLLF